MTDSGPELSALRTEIAEVDRTIALAIDRRLRLARRVGERKSVHREPTRDFAVEEQVLERWRKALGPSGVAGDRAEWLARWLVEESVRTQDEVRAAVAPARSEGDEIAIVGGAGQMGRWLTRFFEDSGHRVAIVDPEAPPPGVPTLPDVETAVSRSAVVLFATPIRSTAPLLRRALESEGSAVIADVLSVKAPIVPVLKAAAQQGRRVTSLHPMFGPSARTLSGRNLLLVSCGVPEADRVARDLFARSAVSISEVELERHDLLIAESLGLAHAVNLLFLAALSSDPASSHELARAASTTFHGQSALARAVAGEGAELYLDIQSLNPHSWGMYQELRTALDRLSTLVERRDLDGFSELLAQGRGKLESEPGAPRQ